MPIGRTSDRGQLDRATRCGGPWVAGVGRAGGLDQQDVRFFLGNRAMLHALGDDEHLTGAQRDVALGEDRALEEGALVERDPAVGDEHQHRGPRRPGVEVAAAASLSVQYPEFDLGASAD